MKLSHLSRINVDLTFEEKKKIIELLESEEYHYEALEQIAEIMNEQIEGFPTHELTNDLSTGVSYINLGDTYDTTICLLDEQEFIICSWGDLLEELETKYGAQIS